MRELMKSWGRERRHLLPSYANAQLAATSILSALPLVRVRDIVNLCTWSAAATRAGAKSRRIRGERMVSIAVPPVVGAHADLSSYRQAWIGELVRNNRLHSPDLGILGPGAR
jgi:hypothetical protein